jgi:hypothetical protein
VTRGVLRRARSAEKVIFASIYREDDLYVLCKVTPQHTPSIIPQITKEQRKISKRNDARIVL